MFPNTRPNIHLLKKQQADSLRRELQFEKERVTQDTLVAKRAQQESLLKIRDLEQQLEEEKAAKLRKQAQAGNRKDNNAVHLRRVRRLQEIGRLILDEQQEPVLPQRPRAVSSLEDAASLLPRQSLLSQDTVGAVSLQESRLSQQSVGGTPSRTVKNSRAFVSERMKAYSHRVKHHFQPERNEQKQLQLDMIREQKATHKPPRPSRVKLSDLI